MHPQTLVHFPPHSHNCSFFTTRKSSPSVDLHELSPPFRGGKGSLHLTIPEETASQPAFSQAGGTVGCNFLFLRTAKASVSSLLPSCLSRQQSLFSSHALLWHGLPSFWGQWQCCSLVGHFPFLRVTYLNSHKELLLKQSGLAVAEKRELNSWCL